MTRLVSALTSEFFSTDSLARRVRLISNQSWGPKKTRKFCHHWPSWFMTYRLIFSCLWNRSYTSSTDCNDLQSETSCWIIRKSWVYNSRAETEYDFWTTASKNSERSILNIFNKKNMKVILLYCFLQAVWLMGSSVKCWKQRSQLMTLSSTF